MLSPPVALIAHDKEDQSPCTRYVAMLAQAFQHLWLVVGYDVYQAFTCVPHTTHPSPHSVLMLTETSWPRGFDARLSLWVHCPEALYRSLPSRTSP